MRALLAYQEDDAGGLMSPRFARLRPDMSVDEALGYLRNRTHVETIYYAYVLDADQHLQGVVSFRDLFDSDRTKTVKDVMRARRLSRCVTEDMDQEAVANVFSNTTCWPFP